MISTAKTSTCIGLPQQSYEPLALSTIAGAGATTKTERPLVKMAIGAAVTVTFEGTFGHYIEFLKIMKQTNAHKSYFELNREIMKKGVIGMFDGFLPWGAVQALAKGAVFSYGHALARQTFQPFVDRGQLDKGVMEVMAGGAGGGFQGLVLSPTLLLKTRVMTDPVFRQKMTPMETTKKSLSVGMQVIKREGLPALMKGSIVFSAKRVADWSTRFFFSVQCEELFFKRGNPDKKLSTSEKMSASLMGGILSTCATLPIDVMVAQIQQASKAGSKVSIIETFRTQFQEGGIQKVAGFATTGFVARAAHVCLTTMFMKTATSVIYEKYVGDN